MIFYSVILIIPSLVLSHPYLARVEEITNHGVNIAKPLTERYNAIKLYAAELDNIPKYPEGDEKITIDHPTLGQYLLIDHNRYTTITSLLEQENDPARMEYIMSKQFPHMSDEQKRLLKEVMAKHPSKEQIIKVAKFFVAQDMHAALVEEFEKGFGQFREINDRIKKNYYQFTPEQKKFLNGDDLKRINMHEKGENTSMEIMALATAIASVVGISAIGIIQITKLNQQQAALKQQGKQITDSMGLGPSF